MHLKVVDIMTQKANLEDSMTAESSCGKVYPLRSVSTSTILFRGVRKPLGRGFRLNSSVQNDLISRLLSE